MDGEKDLPEDTIEGTRQLNEYCWRSGNAEERLHPVKTKKPNELGLYDMSGNIAKWCWRY